MSVSLPSVSRSVVTLPTFLPFSSTSNTQGISTFKAPEEFRFYQCNLHPSNTYACKRISDPSEKQPSGPLSVSQLVSVPTYVPETFDTQYIKNSLAPKVKIIPTY